MYLFFASQVGLLKTNGVGSAKAVYVYPTVRSQASALLEIFISKYLSWKSCKYKNAGVTDVSQLCCESGSGRPSLQINCFQSQTTRELIIIIFSPMHWNWQKYILHLESMHPVKIQGLSI